MLNERTDSLQADELDAKFSALGHTARRDIVAQLSRGERGLSDLAHPFDMSLAAVSKHVRVLADAGLIVVEKRGRTRRCRLNATAMRQAADWLTHYQEFWQDRFKSLANHLAARDGDSW